jgi:hypothetical protein
MQTVTTIGLDIAKSVFQVHGVDAAGQVVTHSVAYYFCDTNILNTKAFDGLLFLLPPGPHHAGETLGILAQRISGTLIALRRTLRQVGCRPIAS